MFSTIYAQTKPKYRGVSHRIAFWVSLAMGAGLISSASGAKGRLAVSIYSVCLSAMFGVSAAFHRHAWSPKARLRMRRLDHSMIFVAIAGTYTPIALLALHGKTQALVLWVAWLGAAAGITIKFVWATAPKWLSGVLYIAMGWAAVSVLPELTRSSGIISLSLLALGGILYTIGAIILALRRPDPDPQIFGYHEVFHAFVIAAALSQWIVIAFYL